MTREEVFAKLEEVFADVFDEEVSLSDSTTAEDVDGWDSLAHLTLISTIEDEFDIEFKLGEINNFKNVGDLADAILKRVG